MNKMHGTTIIGILRNGHICLGGDGQVTLGDTVIKSSALKIRKLYDNKVIAGFAGATADAFSLFEKFEAKLKEHKGNLRKAAVELARDWRSDRVLRRLEAMIITGDPGGILLISGQGDVLEPDDGIIAIGSGGQYALSAARALAKHTQLANREIIREALLIASEICVYTNSQFEIGEI